MDQGIYQLYKKNMTVIANIEFGIKGMAVVNISIFAKQYKLMSTALIIKMHLIMINMDKKTGT